MSYEAEDTCMSHEEEDTCMSYEEEDTCLLAMRRRRASREAEHVRYSCICTEKCFFVPTCVHIRVRV
jgi:DICT domain-containing protein